MISRIDAHQHYWEAKRTFPYGPYPAFLGVISYGWREAGLHALDRDFLPPDLEPQMQAVGCDRSILVNALNVDGETDWMLALAQQHESIAGVVGWLDLSAPAETVAARLDTLRASPKLVGIRHLSQFEPDERWLLRDDVRRGLNVLAARQIPYDLLLNPIQIAHIPALSECCPDLDMVIDHLAKPFIKRGEIEPWASHIRAAAQNPRLSCKLSGMITDGGTKRG